MKRATTSIVVNGRTWKVPRGFGATYRRFAKFDLELIGRGKPGAVITGIRDLLLLIGYEVSVSEVADWPLRKRVEAQVYAATEHARAGDNPVRRHPKPRWLPRPWQGPYDHGTGVFAGPTPTVIG